MSAKSQLKNKRRVVSIVVILISCFSFFQCNIGQDIEEEVMDDSNREMRITYDGDRYYSPYSLMDNDFIGTDSFAYDTIYTDSIERYDSTTLDSCNNVFAGAASSETYTEDGELHVVYCDKNCIGCKIDYVDSTEINEGAVSIFITNDVSLDTSINSLDDVPVGAFAINFTFNNFVSTDSISISEQVYSLPSDDISVTAIFKDKNIYEEAVRGVVDVTYITNSEISLTYILYLDEYFEESITGIYNGNITGR